MTTLQRGILSKKISTAMSEVKREPGVKVEEGLTTEVGWVKMIKGRLRKVRTLLMPGTGLPSKKKPSQLAIDGESSLAQSW